MKYNIKAILAACYANKNLIHYEYSFDNREDFPFAVRVFLSDVSYLYIEDNDHNKPNTFIIKEFYVSKSCYYPSLRVGLITKYFRKYRDYGYNKRAVVPISEVLNFLSNFKSSGTFLLDVTKKNPWYSVTRASGGF
jgi:hypothetical protein